MTTKSSEIWSASICASIWEYFKLSLARRLGAVLGAKSFGFLIGDASGDHADCRFVLLSAPQPGGLKLGPGPDRLYRRLNCMLAAALSEAETNWSQTGRLGPGEFF